MIPPFTRSAGDLHVSCEQELASTRVHSDLKLFPEIIGALHHVGAHLKILFEHSFDVAAASHTAQLGESLAERGLRRHDLAKGRLRTSIDVQTVVPVLTFKGRQQIPEEATSLESKGKNSKKNLPSAVPSKRTETSLLLSQPDVLAFSGGRIATVDQLLSILQPHVSGFSIRVRGECPSSLRAQIGRMIGVALESTYPSIHVDVFPGKASVLVKVDIEMSGHDDLHRARDRYKEIFGACAHFLGIDDAVLYGKNGNPEAKKSAFTRSVFQALEQDSPFQNLVHVYGAHHSSQSIRDLIPREMRSMVFTPREILKMGT